MLIPIALKDLLGKWEYSVESPHGGYVKYWNILPVTGQSGKYEISWYRRPITCPAARLTAPPNKGLIVDNVEALRRALAKKRGGYVHIIKYSAATDISAYITEEDLKLLAKTKKLSKNVAVGLHAWLRT